MTNLSQIQTQMQTMVRSLIEGGIVKSTTPHQYTHPQNRQTYTEYLSDKRDSLVIVARLSPEFTTKGEAWIVERLISEEVV